MQAIIVPSDKDKSRCHYAHEAFMFELSLPKRSLIRSASVGAVSYPDSDSDEYMKLSIAFLTPGSRQKCLRTRLSSASEGLCEHGSY